MICQKCKKNRDDGQVKNGKFYCNTCLVMQDIKKIVDKQPVDSMIITVLKKEIGLPGSVAAGYYNNKEITLDHLIKCVWLFRYLKEVKNYKTMSNIGFMRSLIQNGNKYPMDDGFWEYVKSKRESYDGKDYEILYRAF